jgi:lysophospholipase L1-like esterase
MLLNLTGALQIASLGSSYAAGPGISPQVQPASAGRSGVNYAHLLSKQLGANLTDLSVSGATLLNLLNVSQNTFAPQIRGVPDNSDLILVLGGGNDINYIGGLVADGNRRGPDENQLAARYGAVLDALHSKVPKAQIVVIEYLTILGADVRPGVNVPFNASRIQYHKGVFDSLQRSTAKAADSRNPWCKRIAAASLSDAHGLGSQVPWVSGRVNNGSAAWHPNAAGHAAVANFLIRELNSTRS